MIGASALILFGILMVFGFLPIPGGLLVHFVNGVIGSLACGLGAGILWGRGPALIAIGYSLGCVAEILQRAGKRYPFDVPLILHNKKFRLWSYFVPTCFVLSGFLAIIEGCRGRI